MLKTNLLRQLMFGFQSELDGQDYNDLKNKLTELANNSSDSNELNLKIKESATEFDVLHQSFVRKKISKMASDISVIKVIVVIYFIASVVTAIYMVSKLS